MPAIIIVVEGVVHPTQGTRMGCHVLVLVGVLRWNQVSVTCSSQVPVRVKVGGSKSVSGSAINDSTRDKTAHYHPGMEEIHSSSNCHHHHHIVSYIKGAVLTCVLPRSL